MNVKNDEGISDMNFAYESGAIIVIGFLRGLKWR
jgi:hypothetical protein